MSVKTFLLDALAEESLRRRLLFFRKLPRLAVTQTLSGENAMSLAYHCDDISDTRVESNWDALSEDVLWFLPWKALADVAIAATLLIIMAPLILLVMIVVKVTSPGPAIFKQVRLGRGGRPYHLYKIRTMAHDCERLTGPQWSTAKDPRVNTVGRFLRRSHLDELPQLWNVLRRDMSLIGPRPERPEFVAKLELIVPNYRGRMTIQPGITGLAQVQLPPDEHVEDVHRKVACDLYYIRNMSPVLDLKIYVGTALKIAGFSFAATRQLLDLPGVDGPNRFGDPGLDSGPTSIAQSQPS
jgi:lipopolysaccharide/colanic/teichoic acid biosynthesis glycosyltransferase